VVNILKEIAEHFCFSFNEHFDEHLNRHEHNLYT